MLPSHPLARIASFLLALILGDSAVAGDCAPTNGTHVFDFPFSATYTSPDDNSPKRVLANAHAWDLGGDYPGSCRCSRPNTSYVAPNLFSTRTDLATGYSAPVNGQTLQFYQVNRNIQVASEVWIHGDRQAYVPAPLVAVSNLLSGARDCTSAGLIENFNYRSGSMGRLHLMIDRPFIGEVIIPRTRLFDIVSAVEGAPSIAAQPMASVWMSGRVVVPQSCKLAPGQVTVFDFGGLSPNELPMPGQAPQHTMVRRFQVQCSNVPQMAEIDLSLEGRVHPDEPSALAMNERSDMAIMLKHEGRILPPVPQSGVPRPENIIPLALDLASQRGDFQLEAYPIKLTPGVAPGTFSSQVTLKFDFH